jgi:hypothetical protein
LWPWLALLGILILLVEWYLFGRMRLVAGPAGGWKLELLNMIKPLRGALKRAS